MLMILILALLFLVGAFGLVAEALTRSNRQRKASLARARAYADVADSDEMAVGSGAAWSGAQRWLAPVALRLSPSATLDSISLKIVAAGLARQLSPMSFLATKTLLGAVGVLLGGMLAVNADGALRGIGFVALVAVAMFMLPDVYLTMRKRSRRDRIAADLPDALDLLAVSVTAGLSFDASVARLADSLDGPIVEEFNLTLGEMRIGVDRRQALKNMANRVELSQVNYFTQAVIQSDELGSPLGRTLQVQAEDARKRRQAVAEEKAAKLPIKMIPPTALFIFPVMFIVILGPALLSITDFF